LIKVSEEHSVEAEHKNMGFADTLSSTNPMMKNMLTRVMGLHQKVDVFITPLRPDVGDMIMICSDGLTNYMTERSINTVLDDFSISIERRSQWQPGLLPTYFENASALAVNCTGLLDEAATRQKNISNFHFEKISLWKRLSSREKLWQNATHTVSGNEPKRITKIAEKNLAMCQKIAYD